MDSLQLHKLKGIVFLLFVINKKVRNTLWATSLFNLANSEMVGNLTVLKNLAIKKFVEVSLGMRRPLIYLRSITWSTD